MKTPRSILVIQTAFIGDVILATALLETLHETFPETEIDILVRKGNEAVLQNHPFLRKTMVWDKGEGKYRNLWKLILDIRKQGYHAVINPHRFSSSGLICALSGAPFKSGFGKNPWSFMYTESHPHNYTGLHEVERNQQLIRSLTKRKDTLLPRIYPKARDRANVNKYRTGAYRCIAPASVWHTKQWPAHKWVSLIKRFPAEERVYLLGSHGDTELCERIKVDSERNNILVLAGKLNLLESAALMEGASMNYVNDSAPLHLASAMNAPVTALFCSTVPEFGFRPLSSRQYTIEHPGRLDCRPCGIHGKVQCPKGHFKCAEEIQPDAVLKP